MPARSYTAYFYSRVLPQSERPRVEKIGPLAPSPGFPSSRGYGLACVTRRESTNARDVRDATSRCEMTVVEVRGAPRCRDPHVGANDARDRKPEVSVSMWPLDEVVRGAAGTTVRLLRLDRRGLVQPD